MRHYCRASINEANGGVSRRYAHSFARLLPIVPACQVERRASCITSVVFSYPGMRRSTVPFRRLFEIGEGKLIWRDPLLLPLEKVERSGSPRTLASAPSASGGECLPVGLSDKIADQVYAHQFHWRYTLKCQAFRYPTFERSVSVPVAFQGRDTFLRAKRRPVGRASVYGRSERTVVVPSPVLPRPGETGFKSVPPGNSDLNASCLDHFRLQNLDRNGWDSYAISNRNPRRVLTELCQRR